MNGVNVLTLRQTFVGMQFPLQLWPGTSVSSEHPSSDYLGRYVLTTISLRRQSVHSASVLLPLWPCLADLQIQGVVRREVENPKIYRRRLRIFLIRPVNYSKLLSKKGG